MYASLISHRPLRVSLLRTTLHGAGLSLLIFVAGCSQTPQVVTNDTTPNVPTDTMAYKLPAPAAKAEEKGKKPDAVVPVEAELGIPLYPGAKPLSEEDGALRATKSPDMIAMVTLETTDSLDKAFAFYKQRMPAAKSSDETTDGKRVILLMEPVKAGRIHSVEIRQRDGKTHIELVNVRASSSAELPGAAPALQPDPTHTPSALPNTKQPVGSRPATVPAPILPPTQTPKSSLPGSAIDEDTGLPTAPAPNPLGSAGR